MSEPLCLRIWLGLCTLYQPLCRYFPFTIAICHPHHNPSGCRGRHELIDIPRGMTHIRWCILELGIVIYLYWWEKLVAWFLRSLTSLQLLLNLSSFIPRKLLSTALHLRKTIHQALFFLILYCWLWPIKKCGVRPPLSALVLTTIATKAHLRIWKSLSSLKM